MNLEEMELILKERIFHVHNFFNDRNPEALNSLSNATQALLMVRQALKEEKALEAKYEAERG